MHLMTGMKSLQQVKTLVLDIDETLAPQITWAVMTEARGGV